MYAAGRLDFDSEGLLVLTDMPWVKARLTDPSRATPKTYLVQVELPDGAMRIEDDALERLRRGVVLSDGPTRPAKVRRVEGEPALPPRQPPVRPRTGRATGWIELTISEGKNRQVRRMAAAVGLPTLRLVRTAVGPWRLDGLRSGELLRVAGIPAALFERAAAPSAGTGRSPRRSRSTPRG